MRTGDAWHDKGHVFDSGSESGRTRGRGQSCCYERVVKGIRNRGVTGCLSCKPQLLVLVTFLCSSASLTGHKVFPRASVSADRVQVVPVAPGVVIYFDSLPTLVGGDPPPRIVLAWRGMIGRGRDRRKNSGWQVTSLIYLKKTRSQETLGSL